MPMAETETLVFRDETETLQFLSKRDRDETLIRLETGMSRPKPKPWSKPRPHLFEAKVNARSFCPRAVLEVEDSLGEPYP